MSDPIIPDPWPDLKYGVTKEDNKIFDTAFENWKGVGAKYSNPVAVSKRAVEATWCFLCQGNVVEPTKHEFAALAYIFLGHDVVQRFNISLYFSCCLGSPRYKNSEYEKEKYRA